MGKHLEDFKDKKGKWVQRSWSNGKYTWTISGLAWNGIKERTSRTGTKYSRDNAYLNCTNEFIDFQDFADWHIAQVGYGLGYQLDGDILKGETKKYSKDTCVLVPPALNKFLQSYESQRGEWPQGIVRRGERLYGIIVVLGKREHLGSFELCAVDSAIKVYSEAKNKAGRLWYDLLLTDNYTVDTRVIKYMSDWKYTCNWKQND